MGRVDVVAQPEPRIGEAGPRGRRQAARPPRTRPLVGSPACSSPSGRRPSERPALEPGLDQVVVVVAGARSRSRARRTRRRSPARAAAQASSASASGRSRSSSTSPSRTSRSTSSSAASSSSRKLARRRRSPPLPSAEVEVGDHGRAHAVHRRFRPSRTRPLPSGCRRRPISRPGARSPLRRACSAPARGAAERVAAATGIDEAVERTTEEAIVRALESPAVERAIVRVLESEAAQEALERTLSSPAVERAAVKVLDSELVDDVWDHLLASDEAQRLVERIAEAPEVRAAIAAQGVGLIGDLGRQVRRITERLDEGLERLVRRLLRKPQRAEPAEPRRARDAGARLRARPADPERVFLLSIAVLSAIFGTADSGPSGDSAPRSAAVGVDRRRLRLPAHLLVACRRDPGDALSLDPGRGLRRLARGSAFAAHWRRLGGAVLAAIPLGLGFLGILTRDDRRGWPDRRAGTDVIAVDPEIAPWATGKGRRRIDCSPMAGGADGTATGSVIEVENPATGGDDRHGTRAHRRRGPGAGRGRPGRPAGLGRGRLRSARRAAARRAPLAGRQRGAGGGDDLRRDRPPGRRDPVHRARLRDDRRSSSGPARRPPTLPTRRSRRPRRWSGAASSWSATRRSA